MFNILLQNYKISPYKGLKSESIIDSGLILVGNVIGNLHHKNQMSKKNYTLAYLK